MASPEGEANSENSEVTEVATELPPVPRNDDGLPTSFDVLIVGTGLTESIVSAALSRNGHSVLHIDPREYYGGSWATFGWDQWTSSSFFEVPAEVAQDVEVEFGGLQGKLKWKDNVKGFEQVWYTEDDEIKEELMKQRRRFNIDLMPKLVAAREDVVQLLITSNVSRYLEFLRVSRLLTNLPHPNENVIEPIPLSRSDIFTSKSLSLVEKRSLVKLIEAVMKQAKPAEESEEEASVSIEEDKEDIPESFEELVKVSKVSEKLKHMVKSAVTVLEDDLAPDTFNQEFCSRCRLFLSSIGRYGNQTPFLWTLYGISEICQAFCRLSAVFGGIFILKRYLSKIVTSEEGYVVKTENDEIKVKHVIFGPDMQCDINARERSKKEQSSMDIGRAVLITKGGNIKPLDPNTKSKDDGIFVYRISGVEVIEMNHNSHAVPKDYRLIQLSYPILESEKKDDEGVRAFIEKKLSPFLDFQPANAKSDAEDTVPTTESATGARTTDVSENKKLGNSIPQVIYGSYFKLNYKCDKIDSEIFRSSSSSFIMESAVASTDISNYVTKAKSIFSTLYPDEEFLPKAPDSEDTEEMNGIDSFEEPVNNNPDENPTPAPVDNSEPEPAIEPLAASDNQERTNE